jgi:hypothetical protein
MDMQEFRGELGEDKAELDSYIEFANNLSSFFNQNEGNVIARLAKYKKPLNTVTAEDIRAVFVNPVSDARAAAIIKVLGVMHDMTKTIKPIKDKLPANN